jgi:hypothetical protein
MVLCDHGHTWSPARRRSIWTTPLETMLSPMCDSHTVRRWESVPHRLRRPFHARVTAGERASLFFKKIVRANSVACCACDSIGNGSGRAPGECHDEPADGGYGTKTPTCFLTVATGKRMRFVEELLRRKCCNSLTDDQQANVRIEPTALCPAIRPQSQSSQ